LLNALVRQDVVIVSPVPGTTTDPVEKAMELLPLGPVLLIDTAGIDDPDQLGAQRVERTRRIFERTDLALLVAVAGDWGEPERDLLAEFRRRKVPVVVVFNRFGDGEPAAEVLAELAAASVPAVRVRANCGEGLDDLRAAILEIAPEEWLATPAIVGDLVPPGGVAVLVVPIDLEAPKGRLILPQVQTIRDLLDHDAAAIMVKERELRRVLDLLREPPAIVVTDSQAFLKVAGDVPPSVPLTSFSILFARLKGDLAEFVRGALAIDRLRPGDRVLIAEACSHHPVGEDIGRVKLPRWLTRYVGGTLAVEVVQGHDFPPDLAEFKLAIHCGGCTFNRRAMLSRIHRCRQAGVPITNYGVAIARTLGVFPRALEPFPEAMAVIRDTPPASG
jgi:[FeFe] hydrogenase H-cluster maturation GTPase HydF